MPTAHTLGQLNSPEPLISLRNGLRGRSNEIFYHSLVIPNNWYKFDRIKMNLWLFYLFYLGFKSEDNIWSQDGERNTTKEKNRGCAVGSKIGYR